MSVIIDGKKCINHKDQSNCDINHGAIELFDMCGNKDDNSYQGKKLSITVTGKDIKPITQTITL